MLIKKWMKMLHDVHFWVKNEHRVAFSKILTSCTLIPEIEFWFFFFWLVTLLLVSAKYCALIDKEGGLQLLEELINGNVRPAPYQQVLELANLVRNNVGAWKKEHVTSLLSSEDVMNEDDQGLDLDG